MADLVQHSRKVGEQVASAAWDHWVQSQTTQQPEVFARFKNDGWNYYDDPNADPVDKPDRLIDMMNWLREAGFIDVDLVWLRAGHFIVAAWKQDHD